MLIAQIDRHEEEILPILSSREGQNIIISVCGIDIEKVKSLRSHDGSLFDHLDMLQTPAHPPSGPTTPSDDMICNGDEDGFPIPGRNDEELDNFVLLSDEYDL